MIDIKNLYFRHQKKQKHLFENLECHIKTGNIVGLLGKNGAGKTTLLKIFTGLLSQESGTVNISGYEPIKRNVNFLSQLFFISEEFSLPSISSENYVKIHAGFYPRFDHELFNKLMFEFELERIKNIHKYSYGQKKKFLISFALATKCKILILDEPTNGLDIPSKSIFRKVVAGSLDDDQLVIISTHQVKDVENLIDRIIMLDQGRFILESDLYEISSLFNFRYSKTPNVPDVIYSESTPGGYKVITAEKDTYSSVDIELLFNAITKGSINLNDYVDE